MTDSQDHAPASEGVLSVKDRMQFLPMASGIFAVAMGMTVLLGWYENWTALSRLLPSALAMAYNTALGFILCGAGWTLICLRHQRTGACLGALVAAFMVLSFLGLYLTQFPHLDGLFFPSNADPGDPFPNRVSPLTAACFVLLGLAIFLAGFCPYQKVRVTAIGLAGCSLGLIALVAIFGYAFGIETASGWGAVTRMSLYTALTFLDLGIGLLLWSWQLARDANFNFFRWLPVTASVTLMIMIAWVSASSFLQLQISNDWRQHTYEVLNSAQSFLGNVFDLSRGLRGYVLTGDPATLGSYQKGKAGMPQDIDTLATLTQDNPKQQANVKRLSDDRDALVAYGGQLIQVRQKDLAGAIALESTGQGFKLLNQTLADLHAVTDEEQRLLVVRTGIADANFHNTSRLLVFGSIFAAALLVLANLMASHEMRLRRRTEKRLVEAMVQQKELTGQARAAERAKSEFLAVMSHEIRTPMNGVIGMTSILADSDLDETQLDCVNTIQTSGESLLAVINDILDFSKIESGKMNLEKRAFNIQQCVEEALDIFGTQIRLKGLEGIYLIGPEVPQNLLGDAMRLRQILVNLIGNAIKFTAHGEIVVNVDLQERDDKAYHLLFTVSDTGIGIAPEGLEKLFRAFQQVDTSTTRKYGGTGLGLAISKKLTELMSGKMWAESEPGQGSSFFFTAAFEAAEITDQPIKQARSTGALKTLTVLIVDDNATNRRILETQLRSWRMLGHAVTSGEEALLLLAEKTFDIALIDFQMPDMDGVTLARAIRQTSEMPLVLLSSSGEVITGESGLLFQAQLLKPLKHSLLFAALMRLTGNIDEKPAGVAAKHFDHALAAGNPLRILIAEDNSINQKVGLKMLGQLGYTADLANDGRQAVEVATHTPYDLILMDIQMPDMDGIEATGLIREKLGARCPFIVALTAEALEGDRERFLASGFDDYLSKPLQAKALQGMLKSVPRNFDPTFQQSQA